MNHPQDGLTATPAALALRDVHRAITALRRGGPVRMNPTPDTTLVLLSAETADAPGLAAFTEMIRGAPVLLLSSARTASLLRRTAPAANKVETFCLPAALQTPPALRSLADPTVAQLDNTAWMAQPATPVPAAEAAIALAKLARLLPAVLVAEAARAATGAPSAEHILDYPAAASASLERVIEALVPLEDAPDARVIAFRAPGTGVEHMAIVIGQPQSHEAPLVRIHSECFTGDLLGSLRCDCGPQLRAAIRRIAKDGGGVLLYLSQEGRGIGLVNKLRAYALQDRGLDTYDANGELGWGADERDYLAAATMLEQLGISRLRLLTNNPDKLAALIACGVEVVGRESHVIPPNGVNDRYMAAKVSRFGHLFSD